MIKVDVRNISYLIERAGQDGPYRDSYYQYLIKVPLALDSDRQVEQIAQAIRGHKVYSRSQGEKFDALHPRFDEVTSLAANVAAEAGLEPGEFERVYRVKIREPFTD